VSLVDLFLKGWVAMQWNAMHKTQRGLRLNSLKFAPGDKRRADKLERPNESKDERAYRRRYAT